MLVLLLVALALLVLAAVAFQHRDYGAGLWSRQAAASIRPRRAVTVQHLWLRTTWLASLREHRIGLAAWILASAAFAALMMLLQPAAIDVFEQFSYYLGMVGGAGTTPEVMYATFITDVLAPIVAAFVITQAAGWVADLEQGRVEALLSAPMSWTRLVWERLLAVGAGVAAITVAFLTVIGVGSVVVGAEISLAGLARSAVMCVLLAWAVAAMATIAVITLRSAVALTTVAVYVAFAYLLTWMIPMFDWPAWTERLSIFAAFGHPYREWPSAGSLVLLGCLALIGSVVGAALAERTPKVV